MKNQISVSIMFPFLNDWGTVGSLVSLSTYTVKKYTDDYEVTIIDDGSLQTNQEALQNIVSTLSDNKVKVIHHEKNTGYGGALRDGFEKSKKEWVFYTDCDAQYDPRELSLLIDKLISTKEKNVGMVNGYKIKRNDPWYRTVMGRMYHYTVKALFRLPIRDTDCDFRLIKKEALTQIHLHESTGTICTELVKKIDHAGYQILEVPVHHYWRTSGKSQFFNFKRLYATANNLFKLWYKLMVKKDFVN